MKIRDLLFDSNPYEGFPLAEYEKDIQGWNSTVAIFEEIISQLKPGVILEIGSFKGASAIHMASLCKKYQLDSQVICIDTWLGSPNHWIFRDRPEFYPSLNLKHGYPRLYEQFLANVLHEGMEDLITPFPATSAAAFHVLKAKQVVADLIYIDAAHDYETVKVDLKNYWKLLRSGGVFFGDDFSVAFPGVIRAVLEFSEEMGMEHALAPGDKWYLQKR